MGTGFRIGSRRGVAIAAPALLLGFILLLALTFAQRAEAFVYWANSDGSGGTIGRANLDGTGVNQSFVSGAIHPCGVAVNSSHVFWGNDNATSVGRAKLDGTGANQAIAPADGTCGVTVNPSHLFWVNTNVSDSIGRPNLDGSVPDQDFVTGAPLPFPCGVAVNSTHIFWGNLNGDSIGRADLNGTLANPNFIPAINDPCGVAVDSTHIYWGNAGGNDRAPTWTAPEEEEEEEVGRVGSRA